MVDKANVTFIDETSHYQLIIAPGVYDGPFKGQPVYQIVNREFGVVEAEGPVEIAGRFALVDFQTQRDQYDQVDESPEVPA